MFPDWKVIVLAESIYHHRPNDERLFSTFSGFQLKFQSAPMCLLFFFPVFRSDAFAAKAKSSVNVNIYHFLQFLPRNLGSAVLCGS